MDTQLMTLSQLKAKWLTLKAELKALDERADEIGMPLVHQEDYIFGQLADVEAAIQRELENFFAV
jgi:hypothetical protein